MAGGRLPSNVFYTEIIPTVETNSLIIDTGLTTLNQNSNIVYAAITDDIAFGEVGVLDGRSAIVDVAGYVNSYQKYNRCDVVKPDGTNDWYSNTTSTFTNGVLTLTVSGYFAPGKKYKIIVMA